MNNDKFDPTKPVVIANPATGPKTNIGKAISSRNSTKHGCCADTLILKNENIEDYKALEATWFQAYSPKDDAEKHLVQELANSDWFLSNAPLATTLTPKPESWKPPQTSSLGTEDQRQILGPLSLRYRTAHTNTVAKLRKAIEDYRKKRAAEKLVEAKVSTAEVRLKAVQEKNKPEPTWKEHLEGMRQKAIALGYTPPDLTQR